MRRHAAAINVTLWAPTLMELRSALIHREPNHALSTLLLKFCLQTLLLGFVLFARPQDAAALFSPEQKAPLFSRLTFLWMDMMLLRGYVQGIDNGMMRHLDPADQARTLLSAYQQLRKHTALAWKLASLFRGLLVRQALWAFIAGLLAIVPALLLNVILSAIEQPGRYPPSVLWLLVGLFPLVDLFKSVADTQGLWLGHKLCLRARALLVGEVFAKTLRRKSFGGRPLAASGPPCVETTLAKLKRWAQSLMNSQEYAIALPTSAPESGPASPERDLGDDADDDACTGNIVNLMSIDAYKVGDAMSNLHLLTIQSPMQILVTVALLYRVMGWSAFSGIIIMCLMVSFNISLSQSITQNQERTMTSTDLRIHRTNDLFRNIRPIKYFAWEHHFSRMVSTARNTELERLRSRLVLWATANIAWYAVPGLITFLSFLCYTILEGKQLRPSVAFASISLFTLLRVPLGNLGHVLA